MEVLNSAQDTCPVCHAPVTEARNARTHRPALLNAEPSTDGTFRMVPAADGGKPLYLELTTRERFGRTDLHRLHARECGPRTRRPVNRVAA